jgi:1-acyl-sn-glycerol-3-phosphate acyltransferase
MITAAAFLEHEPPLFLRSMIERFVPTLPFVSVFLARCGQILGTPENCRRILESEQSILVFPEGVRGLNKSWRDRYRLQRFGQGFMRLAIETGTPIVPCAVVGAEEQAPTVVNAKRLAKAMGLPALPITLSPGFGTLPLPTRYRIYFGAPMHFEGNANDEDQVIVRKVDQVKSTLQRMLDEGVAEREHVFW